MPVSEPHRVMRALVVEQPGGPEAMRLRQLPAPRPGPGQVVENLIRRGQSEGAFRTDLPASWLVSVLHHVLKGAAADIGGGRLDPSDAPHFIVATVLAAFEE